jgi:hypothetical protein
MTGAFLVEPKVRFLVVELAGKWNPLSLGEAAEVVTPLHETLPLSGVTAPAASALG